MEMQKASPLQAARQNHSQTMTTLAIEVIIIVLLLVVNGVFAMTEIAVVSARKTWRRLLAANAEGRRQREFNAEFSRSMRQ